MEKRKLNRITAGFIVLVVMVLILMFSNSLRRSSHITLPEVSAHLPGYLSMTILANMLA